MAKEKEKFAEINIQKVRQLSRFKMDYSKVRILG